MIKKIIIILSMFGLIPSLSCHAFECRDKKEKRCGGMLEEAIYLSHACCIQELLKDKEICSRLKYAYYSGFHEKHTITPLQFALWYARAEIIPILLAAGADPRFVDNAGWDCFHFAAFSVIESHKKTKLLLETGADCTRKTKTESTAVDIAASWGNIETVKLLLSQSVSFSPIYADEIKLLGLPAFIQDYDSQVSE